MRHVAEPYPRRRAWLRGLWPTATRCGAAQTGWRRPSWQPPWSRSWSARRSPRWAPAGGPGGRLQVPGPSTPAGARSPRSWWPVRPARWKSATASRRRPKPVPGGLHRTGPHAAATWWSPPGPRRAAPCASGWTGPAGRPDPRSGPIRSPGKMVLAMVIAPFTLGAVLVVPGRWASRRSTGGAWPPGTPIGRPPAPVDQPPLSCSARGRRKVAPQMHATRKARRALRRLRPRCSRRPQGRRAVTARLGCPQPCGERRGLGAPLHAQLGEQR